MVPGRAAHTAVAVTVALVAALALWACGTARVDQAGSTVEYVPLTRPTAPGHDAVAPSGPAWRGEVTARCLEVEPLIRAVAAEEGVDPSLIAAIVRVESAFQPRAVSRRGARGLMQVMPSVGRRLGCGDLFEPRRNLRCGAIVLKRFLARFDERLVFGLSAYNAGYRVPNAALAADTLPSNYRYVEKVLAARSTYLAHGCGR